MALYKLSTAFRTGDVLRNLPYRNIQGDFFLNQPKALRWEMPLYHEDVKFDDFFYPGRVEVHLYRDDVKVFEGPLWDAVPSSKEGKVSCFAESVEGYFDIMQVDFDFKDTGDQGELVWDIINQYQGLPDGDKHISKGTIEPGTNRKFNIYRREGRMIRDVLDDLTELVDGFDYEVDTLTREFNIWSPRRDAPALTKLTYGGNIRHYSIQYMGKYARSHIMVQGPRDMVEFASDSAAALLYGRSNYVDSFKDATNRSSLVERAELVRDMRKALKLVPHISVVGENINPFRGELSYGETVHVEIQDGPVTFDTDMRCIGFQLTIGKHGNETFNFYLNDTRETDPGGLGGGSGGPIGGS